MADKKNLADQEMDPQCSALRKEIELLAKRLMLVHMLEDYDLKSQDPTWMSQDFEHKVASLMRTEADRRNANAVRRFRREANLPYELEDARFGDVLETSSRKIDTNVLEVIRNGQWMLREKPADLVVTGACGVGKSFIAACCANWMIDHRRSVYFIRASRLLQDLRVHDANNTLEQRKLELKSLWLLVLDDFLLEELDERKASDLLDVISDRIGRRSTIFTSQFKLEGWIQRLGEHPLGQAILDRIANSAYRLHLSGPSLRRSVQPEKQ